MKGYRTIIFNILAAILPILESAEFTNLLTQEQMELYALAILIGNGLLRFVTNTSIGKSE